jgi:hypothetical protein
VDDTKGAVCTSAVQQLVNKYNMQGMTTSKTTLCRKNYTIVKNLLLWNLSTERKYHGQMHLERPYNQTCG